MSGSCQKRKRRLECKTVQDRRFALRGEKGERIRRVSRCYLRSCFRSASGVVMGAIPKLSTR
mgnify:FL=1